MKKVWNNELQNQFANASYELSIFVAGILNKCSISEQDREAIHERAAEEGISIKAIDVFLDARLNMLLKEIEEEKTKEIEEEKENGRAWEGELQKQFATASIEFSRFVATVLSKHSISEQDREAIHERAAEEGISIKAIDVFLDAQLKELLSCMENKRRREEAKKREEAKREEEDAKWKEERKRRDEEEKAEEEKAEIEKEKEIVDSFSRILQSDSTEILTLDISCLTRAENLNRILNIITQQLISLNIKKPNAVNSFKMQALIRKYLECEYIITINYPNDERFATMRSGNEMATYLAEQRETMKKQAEETERRQKEDLDKILAMLKKFFKKYGIYILLFYIILVAICIIFI